MRWKPLDKIPRKGEFLAENENGDWLKVERYNPPYANDSVKYVINRRTGNWWTANKWMPLPMSPKGE